MNSLYLSYLLYQFDNAIGESTRNVDSSSLESQFIDWVRKRTLIGRNYKSLLRQMGINFNIETAVEIGKGRYDSIISSLDRTSAITLFSYGIDDFSGKRIIIDRDFKVRKDGIPTVIYDNKLEMPVDETFDLYMTHNPYVEEFIKNWEMLPSRDCNFVIGIYGNTFDKDYVSKIEMLKRINENLSEKSTLDGGTIRDKYCYALTSTNNEKKKVLAKSYRGVR